MPIKMPRHDQQAFMDGLEKQVLDPQYAIAFAIMMLVREVSELSDRVRDAGFSIATGGPEVHVTPVR